MDVLSAWTELSGTPAKDVWGVTKIIGGAVNAGKISKCIYIECTGLKHHDNEHFFYRYACLVHRHRSA